jgi:hypothetical protein
MACAIAIVASGSLCVHYLLNRLPKRLFWEGIVASIAIVSLLWLPFGSWCFFYFGFAPLPSLVRELGLTFCFTVTAWWIWLSWRNYQQATIRLDLVNRLYVEKSDCIIYPSGASDAHSMHSNRRRFRGRLPLCWRFFVRPLFISNI